MAKIKTGLRFMDSDFKVHIITKVTAAYGKGFVHLYKDEGNNDIECFMLKIAFDRLTKCGAIYVLQ